MKFFILDGREVWHQAAIAAAQAQGFQGQRITRGEEAQGPGIGFIRPTAAPAGLKQHRRDFRTMAGRLTMIQDAAQVALYDDKSGQHARWGEWMPDTWRFTDHVAALAFLEHAELPLVSKADCGASSVNVRILKTLDEARRHVAQAFGPGIEVKHCADGAKSMQKGYVLLQRFIPHRVTWRVNAIGNARAAFRRFCYPDRPVAQTGNVEPVMSIDDEVDSLFEYADRFFHHAGTKWCAVDILRDGDQWRLLETSLAWPWPSPGTCNEAPIFGTNRAWGEMFDALFDEVRAGAWES